jgi:hypothetical protein
LQLTLFRCRAFASRSGHGRVERQKNNALVLTKERYRLFNDSKFQISNEKMHLLVWNKPKKWEKSSGISHFEKAYSRNKPAPRKKKVQKKALFQNSCLGY